MREEELIWNKLSDFILEISEKLILIDLNEFETGFSDILKLTIESLDFDSAFLLYQKNGQTVSYLEYVSEHHIPFLQNKEIFLKTIHPWYERAKNQKEPSFQFIPIKIPNSVAEFQLYVKILPLLLDGEIWGHLCFFSHQKTMEAINWPERIFNLIILKLQSFLTQTKKQSELVSNKDILDDFLSQLISPFIIVNRAFEVVRFNTVISNMLKEFFDKDILLNTRVDQYGRVPQDAEKIIRNLKRCFGGEKVNVEIPFKNKENMVFWFDITYHPIQGKEKEILFCAIEITDITSKKRIEKNLSENREITKKIFKITPDHMYIYDIWNDYNIFDNKGLGKLLGIDENKSKRLTSADIRNLMHPEDRQKPLAILEELKNTQEINKTFVLEYRIMHTDGKYRHFYDRINVFKTNEEGKIWFILGAVSDVSHRKLAEKALSDSQKNLQSVLDNSIQAFFLINREYEIIVYNDLAKRLIAKIWNKTLRHRDVIQKYSIYNSVTKFENLFIECFSGRTIHFEKEIQYTEEDSIWFEIHLSPIFNEDRSVNSILYSILDITDRKKAEDDIKATQILYKTVAENYPNGTISIFDKSLNLIFTAGALYKKINVNPEKLVGLNLYKLFKHFPDIIEKADEYYIKAFEGKSSEFEVFYSNRFFVINCMPLIEKDGKINSIISFAQDITERKESELTLEKLSMDLIVQNQELMIKEQDVAIANKILVHQKDELNKVLEELSERNFELDQIIYKTSHDIRSPLASILGLINLMKIEEDVNRKEGYVEYIEKSIFKLDRFTKSMLDYAKNNRTGVQSTEIDFAEIIEQCLGDLQYLKNFNNISIKIKIKPEGYVFRNDLFRLNIIFSNIISNAIKYVNPGIRNSYLKINIQINKSKAKILFKDNGIGIAKEYIDKIFDMFFRATDNAEGSGLGLYIVKQTVERLQGSIEIESKLNEGTVFRIEIPNL